MDQPLTRAPAHPTSRIVRLGIVSSTQTVAFELAEGGAADGTVVVAETQTAGRGSRGRAWHDERGDSVLASIVVRPTLILRDLPKLSMTTAVAVAEAVTEATGLAARLKWPNDVLVRGRKVAGILLESRILDGPIVVVGIGVNVRQHAFPPALAASATSIRLEGGREIERDAMLETVLARFDAWRQRLEREGFTPVRERWLALADTLGRAVTVGAHSGVAVDVDGDGALVLRHAGGLSRAVAGEVTETR